LWELSALEKLNSTTFDAVVIGAGIAGLATAVALVEKFDQQSQFKLAVIDPNLNTGHSFAANQPGIAMHPNLSADNNLLSQWTAWATQPAYQAITRAHDSFKTASVITARGRWRSAQTHSDIEYLQKIGRQFNQTVAAQFHCTWQADKGLLGALWLPNQLAIDPMALRQSWLDRLATANCVLINAPVSEIIFDSGSSRLHVNHWVESQKIFFCLSRGLHPLLSQAFGRVDPQRVLPVNHWSGSTQICSDAILSSQWGQTTVHNTQTNIALDAKRWVMPAVPQESQTKIFSGERWHAPDRMPYIGPAFDLRLSQAKLEKIAKNNLLPIEPLPNCFLNTAHNTRALVSAIAGAAVLTEAIGTPSPAIQRAIDPARYVRRGLNLARSVDHE
jgi:glycine/D-amino acid oxidase-like deaminating enzyme